jgi:SAM-dependent methyltransferase
MRVAHKLRNILRGFLQAYGDRRVKRYLWNLEFSQGRWACLDSTPGDCVYQHLEQYARGGSILDLGCGSGNTGNELNRGTYRRYVGVDISDVALDKARIRSRENHRAETNSYVQADIFDYVPAQKFDVILFRDSIYYIPHGKVPRLLDRYSHYLNEGGVFVVRMLNANGKYMTILDAIDDNFHIVDKQVSEDPQAIVTVFRPDNRVKLRERSSDSTERRDEALSGSS